MKIVNFSNLNFVYLPNILIENIKLMQVILISFIIILFIISLYQDFGRKISLKPKFINEYTKIYRDEGFKGVIKKGGWRLLIYFFMFYLIRDSILYILIPYLISKGFIDIFAW